MYIVYSFSFFWFEAIYNLLNTPKIVLIQRVSNMLTCGHLTMIFSHLKPEGWLLDLLRRR